MPELHRVFPWDPAASPYAPFSPEHVPPTTGRGRFDLRRSASSVLYAAEVPEHAVAEFIQPWRGREFGPDCLELGGHPIALVRVGVDADTHPRLIDLCDPGSLVSMGCPPDLIASRHRDVTQPIADGVWDAGHAGLRWWSSFWGDWHTVVLFMARLEGRVTFGEPEPLTLESPALRTAADLLGVTVVRG